MWSWSVTQKKPHKCFIKCVLSEKKEKGKIIETLIFVHIGV